MTPQLTPTFKSPSHGMDYGTFVEMEDAIVKIPKESLITREEAEKRLREAEFVTEITEAATSSRLFTTKNPMS